MNIDTHTHIMNEAVRFVRLDRFHISPPLQLEAAIVDAFKVTPEVLQQLLQERQSADLSFIHYLFTVRAPCDHCEIQEDTAPEL